jgi:hypothetical protein
MRVTQGTTDAPVVRAIYASPVTVAAGTPKNGTNTERFGPKSKSGR